MMKTAGSGGNLQPVTVVLVTDQFRCKRLITAGMRLADRDGTRLEVVNVASPGVERNPEAIEYLFQVSRENDAAMTIHYSDAPARFLGELIQEKCPAAVVTGLPGQGSTLLHRIWMRFEQISFFTVDHEGELRPVTIADRVVGQPAAQILGESHAKE